jgi:hypothetical protein
MSKAKTNPKALFDAPMYIVSLVDARARGRISGQRRWLAICGGLQGVSRRQLKNHVAKWIKLAEYDELMQFFGSQSHQAFRAKDMELAQAWRDLMILTQEDQREKILGYLQVK